MKNLISRQFIFLILLAGMLSCKEDEQIEDPVYEFVAFQEGSVLLNEKSHSLEPYPLVAKILAFQPYAEDIVLNLEITGTNAVEGEDFSVLPGTTLLIRAGRLISDTLYLRTIDNDVNSGERSISISIISTSIPDLKIGLGLTEPKNATVKAQIIDDECSETIEIFNASSFTNNIAGGNPTTVEGVLISNNLTLTGNLIDYGAFSGAKLTLNLVPNIEGGTVGSANFGEQETGADSDGYEYKFVQTGEGWYDVCEGTIAIEYDIYYLDGGEWIYWYSVNSTLVLN